MDSNQISKSDLDGKSDESNNGGYGELHIGRDLSDTQNGDSNTDDKSIDECSEVTTQESIVSTENKECLSSVNLNESCDEESKTSMEKSECHEPSSDFEQNTFHENKRTLLESTPSYDKLIFMRDCELVNGVVNDKVNFRSRLCRQETIAKMKEIIHALEVNNVKSLRNAALSAGGLLNDNIRRKVWPKIVGVDVAAISPRPSKEEIEEHPYYQQVVLDVNRSLKRFPPSIQESQRLAMLDQLVILIMRVLCKHPELHYYQGYHDICVTFLLVLGEETAYHVVEKLSLTHLKIFMEKSMEPTIHLLEHIYHIIGKVNPTYEKFLIKSEVGVAYCLSWLITWFSHVLNDYNTVVRFFDFFIASHYWMPMYVTTSLVIYRELEVIKQDCDMASVHSLLCNIQDNMPSEDLLTESIKLFNSYKPSSIMKERPYIKIKDRRKIKQWTYFSRLRYIPTTLVIAAAVLFTAYIYQVYRH